MRWRIRRRGHLVDRSCPAPRRAELGARILSAGWFDDEKNDEVTIVLTGDHAGPNSLGNDTDIKSGRPDGVGDQDLFSDDLRDKAGHVAGRSSAVCITTSPFAGDPNRPLPKRGANLCTIGFALKDGKITVSGIATDDDFKSGGITLPIVGGTGKYRSATGEFTVKFAPIFTNPATLTFRLSKLTIRP